MGLIQILSKEIEIGDLVYLYELDESSPAKSTEILLDVGIIYEILIWSHHAQAHERNFKALFQKSLDNIDHSVLVSEYAGFKFYRNTEKNKL